MTNYNALLCQTQLRFKSDFHMWQQKKKNKLDFTEIQDFRISKDIINEVKR